MQAIEVVTADGRFVRADPEHEPDLFKAQVDPGNLIRANHPVGSASDRPPVPAARTSPENGRLR